MGERGKEKKGETTHLLSHSDTHPLSLSHLFIPAACFLAFIRLLQFTLINKTGAFPLDSLLGTAPPPFFVVLITSLVGLMMRTAWPHVRPMWIVAGTVFVGTGLMVGTAQMLPPWLTGWVGLQAFEAVRWDLLVLLVLALVSSLMLRRMSDRFRQAGLFVLHTVVFLLLMLPVFELGGILALGAAPDWSMLIYTFRNLDELAPILASEIGLAQAALLLLPMLITLIPILLRIGKKQAPPITTPAPIKNALSAQRSESTVWQTVAAALPVLLLLVLPPSTPLPPTHRTISYAGMVQSMVESTQMAEEALIDLTGTTPVAFDTQAMRLAPSDSTRRLNVVVVLLESVRSRSVTPYAPNLATTPFLDSLAEHSLLVEHMYAVVPYTNKSMAPIFGGMYPELMSYDVKEIERLPGPGLPALLKPLGYRSAFFTPATLGYERKDKILAHLGFDHAFGDGAYPTEGFHRANYFGFEDRIMLDPSMAWVDESSAADQPFFLAYLTLTAHHEYQTPPGFPVRPFEAHNETLNQYLNAIRYTDDFLRDLFRAFEQRGLLESTLFVVMADHGEAFGEHGLKTHGDVLWDEALQIPTLLYNPVLFPAGRRVEGLRQYIDVLPTVAEALGVSIENGILPGYSLLQAVPEDRILFHNARNGRKGLAMRQDSLKFFYYHRSQPMEVYDFINDPFERHNIADQIAPERLKAAEVRLLLWQRSVQQIYDGLPSADLYATR